MVSGMGGHGKRRGGIATSLGTFDGISAAVKVCERSDSEWPKIHRG